MAKIWTSDLHHEHNNIVKFTNRGVDTTQEGHTDFLRALWNAQVKPQDTVYHLGDFSFSRSYPRIAEFIRSLNGLKVFIKGNHCDPQILTRLVEDRLIHAWYDYKEIKVGEQKVCLFHFPIAAWHQQGRGSWHLHGHCHGNLKESFGKRLDVGLDNAYNLYGKHKFFTEQDIQEYMDAAPVEIADHHVERP